MEKTRVGIEVDRLLELLKKEAELELLKKIFKKADASYGYTSETSKIIDTMLDIERDEE